MGKGQDLRIDQLTFDVHQGTQLNLARIMVLSMNSGGAKNQVK
jgi:hypothetical protein